ncbi:NmrA family NAD(P)-binding protein [Solicola gregarius]|uniref:NAD(P)H-binding protein n=1 Tax=Solicola gregarius TaxID=2908642 RepID=A0AA46YM96_9ACTN|nr:NAD(P)H-binding protein [Solicola gregarius]UYM06419.1 NAD(P)H-binding protein [Solicola gregarius]
MNNTQITSESNNQPVLVVGGTGKTGRRVVRLLTERGVPTRVGSRNADPAFDWQDRSTWAPALRGVRAVYLTYAPDTAVPGATDDVATFVRTAVDSGVRHIVLLSGRGEAEAEACERLVQEAGIDWTVLRSSFFAQNFSENFWRDEMVATGELALPVGDVPEPFVDIDDIAEVAVAALTEPGHAGRLYELTGPRLLTFADATHEIAEASGRDFNYRALTHSEFAGALEALELPDDVRSLLVYLFTEVMDGRNASTSAGVQQALGRPARDFRDYARSTAATGVWNG